MRLDFQKGDVRFCIRVKSQKLKFIYDCPQGSLFGYRHLSCLLNIQKNIAKYFTSIRCSGKPINNHLRPV